MKYYKYLDEEGPVENGIRYIETEDGWTIREVTTNGEMYRGSNVYYPGEGIHIGEGLIGYDELAGEGVIPISEEEFDEVWNAHLKRRELQWLAVKQIFPPGKKINGFIEIFYPQGVIISLGDDALGVADHQACNTSVQSNFLMHSGNKISAVVKSYDEVTQWVILDSPQVYENQGSYDFAPGNRDGDS